VSEAETAGAAPDAPDELLSPACRAPTVATTKPESTNKTPSTRMFRLSAVDRPCAQDLHATRRTNRTQTRSRRHCASHALLCRQGSSCKGVDCWTRLTDVHPLIPQKSHISLTWCCSCNLDPKGWGAMVKQKRAALQERGIRLPYSVVRCDDSGAHDAKIVSIVLAARLGDLGWSLAL
jgi:hypothetical protein